MQEYIEKATRFSSGLRVRRRPGDYVE